MLNNEEHSLAQCMAQKGDLVNTVTRKAPASVLAADCYCTGIILRSDASEITIAYLD